jgi:DnaA family protein
MPPSDLSLREDLRTRLGWGHIFQLQVLSEPERRAVLRQQADERGVFLSDEVMDFMLNRFSRDLSSLIQLLDQLDGYALQTQRAITIPLIKAMLEAM